MRRIDEQIDIVRQNAANTDFSVDSSGNVISGLGDRLLIEFANRAQRHLQAIIISTAPQDFTVAEEEIDVVADQEEYTVADNIFINNKFISVELSVSGRLREYEPLAQKTLAERNTSESTCASFYIRRAGKILLNPIPSSNRGKIRVNYYEDLDILAKRAGDIASITGTGTTGDPLTAITINTTIPDADGEILDDLNNAKFVCVNDDCGVVTARRIPVTSYTSGTGVIAVDNYVFDTGESITTGDFVTVGKHSTTHSKLPENAEDYLLVGMEKRIFSKDSNQRILEADQELLAIEARIRDAFVEPNEDPLEVPILDPTILF